MKKLSNDVTRNTLFNVIGVVIISIFTFCVVACLYKLLIKRDWIGPSIFSVVFIIIGGVLTILTETWLNLKETNDVKETNLLLMLLIISIVLTAIVLFITAVAMNMDNYWEYPIITFLSIWFGMIGSSGISELMENL